MGPDRSRSARPPAARPLPPARTLRAELAAPAKPVAAWVAPVTSGLTRGVAIPASHAGMEPDLPFLTELELEAELVLDEEVYWVDDPGVVIEALDHGESIPQVEGLRVTGDLSDVHATAHPVSPPINAWDLGAEPREAAEREEQVERFRTEWEALGRELADSVDDLLPGTVEPPVPDRAPPPLVVAGAIGRTVTPDPAELANRLERLADQLRMHGTDAIAAARAAADPVEAAIAAALAGLLARPAN